MGGSALVNVPGDELADVSRFIQPFHGGPSAHHLTDTQVFGVLGPLKVTQSHVTVTSHSSTTTS
jgi:hypothetical protein